MHSEIVEAFHRVVRDTPDRRLIYLPATDSALTAADVWSAGQHICRLLDAAGVDPRRPIVSVLGNRPAYLASFLACRMRDQALCPLDSSTPPGEIIAIATQLGASAVLTLCVDSSLTITQPKTPGDARHGAAVLLKRTSGSTGRPRATLTPEAALMSDSRALMSAMNIRPDDIQFAAIPLSHAYAIGNLVVPLFIQGTPIVMREAFFPHRLPDDARRFGARGFPGVPYMFDHFTKSPPPEGWPPTLCNLISAGAALDTHVAVRFRELFGVKIHSFYGTSETGGIAYDATEEQMADGVVGTPLPGVSLELVPHDGAPEGGGRVLVRGPSVIQSYADNIDTDSFVRGGFLTGDLGTIDCSGRLTLAGRVSSFVNIAGRKVQPDEVERVLLLCDGVADVRVLGIADERRGEQLVACVVMNGTQPSVLALRQFCAARLAAHKIPRAFVFVDAIPLNERGKTDRIRLRAAMTSALSEQTGML